MVFAFGISIPDSKIVVHTSTLIVPSIKLAEIFNKGKGFIVGLVILPLIFQPILGYQKDE